MLQEVVDSARRLTSARYGVITSLGDAAIPPAELPPDWDRSAEATPTGSHLVTFFASGLTDEERSRLQAMPERLPLFDYLRLLQEPLRIPDFFGHVTALGLPEFTLRPVGAFLAAPIRHQGETVGNIFLANDRDEPAFTREDEETVVLFAAQAALVITNARRYRDEQRARAGLETLIDTSPVGVVVFDARTGVPLSFNQEALRILQGVMLPNRPAEDLLDVLTVRRADGHEVSLVELQMSDILGAGETLRAEELVLSVPDGRSVTTLVNVSPMRSESGEVESVVVTMQDLTPLEELERLRAEFLGMVSHELRAPLTSIKGSADMMLESLSSLDPAELVQFIHIIRAQADRMRDLIAELLDVARIESGSLSVSPEPTEVAALVDEARNTFLSGGGRESLAIDLEPELPRVMADRRRVVQVLGNLLSNAARHSDASSLIRISAAKEGGYVAIAVADEGRGVEPERLPNLFRKFSAGEDRGGTGLGLSISKGIVEAHGGRIRAESAGMGLGTRFTFTLPVMDGAGVGSPDEVRIRSPRAGEEEAAERGLVLAVDDDPSTLRYLRSTLSKAGYATAVTGDPGEALRIVESDRPSLVVLDLVLPGWDGIELMRSILGIADLPVIFLSGYGRDEVIARALEAGATDYIVKPFSSTELVARVRGALRRRLLPSRAEPSGSFVLGDLAIDYAGRRVEVGGSEVHLTPTEYDLLHQLSVNAGRVMTHEALLDKIWGLGHSGSRGSVRTYVKRLRRKLNDDASSPRYVFAEPRIGYRMGRPEQAEAGRSAP